MLTESDCQQVLKGPATPKGATPISVPLGNPQHKINPRKRLVCSSGREKAVLGQRAQGGLGVPRGAPQGEYPQFPTADLTGAGQLLPQGGSYSVLCHIPVDTWGKWTPGPHSYLDDSPAPALRRCPLPI